MKTIAIEIKSHLDSLVRRAGEKLLCDDCERDTFLIFTVNGHTHLQCSFCDTVFCPGGCEDA